MTALASKHDEARIASRIHPLGAPLPVLDVTSFGGGYGGVLRDADTTFLGVTTEWKRDPKTYPDPLLNLYSWSSRDRLTTDGQTFVPGASCLWRDRKRLAQGGKPWKVTLVAVATEHVGRVLHLCPALMVRLYNGTLSFALPSEVLL